METAIAQEALRNATQNVSTANYGAIYAGFKAKGIGEADIQPRVNVFTFNAWKALGRSVRKGEHGVRVCTWVPMTKRDATGEAQPIGRKPRATTVFHVSQTEAIESDSDADTGQHAEVNQQPEPRNPDAPSKDRLAQMRAERAAAVAAIDLGGSGYYSTEFTPMGGAG